MEDKHIDFILDIEDSVLFVDDIEKLPLSWRTFPSTLMT